MRKEHRQIVSNALEKLPSKLVTAVIKENYFVTYLHTEDGYQVMVDFTKRMEFDFSKFVEKTQRLYEEFALTSRWYEC